MSKIIAFPKHRCYTHQRQTQGRARVNVRQPSPGRSPPNMGRNGLQSDTVEPIWKSSTHGTLMSVVVPTCNRPHLLNRCLAALANQIFDPSRFEIIVVDDAPSHGTREVVEKWSAQLASTGPRIFYIPCNGPHGPAAARNRGWRAARGPLIAFTDDDTIPYRDWLVHGFEAFNGIVQAVWGRVVMPVAGLPTEFERDAKKVEQTEFASANCFCMKRVLEDLGGFDERFRFASREDADLYFRLLQANVSITHAPNAIVEHPTQPAVWGASVAQQKTAQFDALLYKKHPDLYRAKIRASAHWDYYAIVASLLLAIAALCLQKFSLAALAGSCWLLLTARFCLQRLRGTVKSFSHVIEMMVTSALVPPLAVFWRAFGAIRFRGNFV